MAIQCFNDNAAAPGGEAPDTLGIDLLPGEAAGSFGE